MKYAFVAEHRPQYPVRRMCRCLNIHPSGFYAWIKIPLSHRAREDARQTKLLKEARKDSGKVYGYPLAGRALQGKVPRGASCTTISSNRARQVAQTAFPGWHDWQGSAPRSAPNASRASMAANHLSWSTIRWIGNSMSLHLTLLGSQTSLTSKPTKGSCIWPSLSTCTHVVSSAGRPNHANQLTLFFRPCSWPFGGESQSAPS